jgi:MFS family permease
MPRKSFLKKTFPLLGFGYLFSFFSGFGQTYIISLYVPAIAAFFSLSNAGFGSIYATATIASGFTLPWLGSWYDKTPLKRYAFLVLSGLSLSLFLLSVSDFLWSLVLSIYGLRLFGQGLMGHTAVSTAARYFHHGRGKAIGTATLGHPTAEAIMPILTALVIGAIGWRASLQVSSLICLVLVLPAMLILLNRSKVRIRAYGIRESAKKEDDKSTKFYEIFFDRKFWIMVPLIFCIGFINTALFFFQLKMGIERNWSTEWIAASVSAFAIANALGLTIAGPLVDRMSGQILFRRFSFPYLIGLIFLITFKNPIFYPISLFFLGFSNGMGSTIKNALMVELYGVSIIGKVRSTYSTISVISTGLGPAVFGLLLDLGIGFEGAFSYTAIGLSMAILNAHRKFKLPFNYTH